MTLKRTGKLEVRKPLAPMSDKRRAKLAAQGVKYPTSTFAPARPKMAVPRQGTRQQTKDTNPDDETVEAVLKRADGKCESCGEELYGRRGIEYSIHHRKRRSQGGDNRLSNLVALCGHGTSGCHGAAHSEVAQAQVFGFLVLSTDRPEAVPVDLARHGRSRLTNGGGHIPAPEQEACA